MVYYTYTDDNNNNNNYYYTVFIVFTVSIDRMLTSQRLF